MEINYGEILFETIGMIAGNQQSLVQVVQDEIVEEEELAAMPVVDPMADIIQMEKLSVSNIGLAGGQTVKLNKSWNFTKSHDYDLISLETSITANSEQVSDKSYGIQLILSTNTKQYIVQFDSTEMLGNPYNFIQALQKKSFSLSEIKNLRSIEIKLFNSSETDVVFNNINLVVGYSLASYTAAAGTLVLYTDDEKLEYETNALGELGAGSTRNIYARWVYQDDNDTYLAITHNNYNDLPLGVNVFWYKYSQNATSYDEFGGQNWIKIDSNKFVLQNYTFSPEVEQEQFKLVIIDSNQDSGQLSIITSNILTFTNKKENQIEVIKNGVIKLNDDSNGIYPYYSWDGYIDDKFGYQTSVVRLMELTYNSSIEYIELAKKIKEVIWKIPQEHMKFIAENLQDGKKGDYSVEQIVEEDTEGYLVLTIKVLNAAELQIETDGKARGALKELFSTTFGIKGRRISSPWKNDIVCSIILDDNSEYTFSRDVSFNVAGESGSEYSVIVRIKDAAGNVCNAVPKDKADYSLVLSVYDSDGQSITESCGIEYASFYSYMNASLLLTEQKKGVYSIIQIPSFFALGVIFTITLPSGNKIVKYVGVPMCASDINPTIVRYNGPSEIVYNHAGVEPEFNDSNIELIGVNNIDWSGELPTDSGFVLKKTSDDVYQLTVGNSYFQEWTGPIYYLSAKNGTKEVWRQPLLIYQNPYFSSLINDWDNALKIDNDNNVIFSSAYIAGSKSNNLFTGAILGELGTVADGKKVSSETGLFGYNAGTQVFGFKTDGTAFIGPSSGGRILFNGNKGQIYSGNFDGWKKDEKGNDIVGDLDPYNPGTLGTYLDLDDGLLITNSGRFRGHIEATSGEFTGDIKGGTISIGEDVDFPNFHVDNKGDVTSKGSFVLSGNIKLNGNITWGTGTSPTQVVYTQVSNPSKPTNGTAYSKFPSESTTAWHQTFKSGADKFASYTYDGGITWTNAVKIVGDDGSSTSAGMTQDEKNAFEALADAVNSSVINGEYIISPKIGGGYLAILKKINGQNSGVIIDPLGGYDNTNQPIFKVLSNGEQVMGVNKDGTAIFKGNITVTGGTIGGFNIGLFNFSGGSERQALYYGIEDNEAIANFTNGDFLICPDGAYGARFGLNGYNNGYRWVMLAGNNFGLTQSGVLYASEANITGKLKSGPGSSLGDWTVSTPNGYVFGKMADVIDTDSGQYYGIGFDTNAVGTTNRAFAIGPLQGIGESSSWANATFYVTGKGKMVAKNAEIYGSIRTSISTNNFCQISGSSITAGNWTEGLNWTAKNTEGTRFDLDGTGLYFKIKNYGTTTPKTALEIYIASGSTYISRPTNDTSYASASIVFRGGWNSQSQGKLEGTWNSDSFVKNDSWRGAKHDIEQLDDRYSVLFDNLIPVRFKYNNGASGRYHTGLILDELKGAMDIANISTQEFAAYCIDDPETGKGGIRYESFISLLIKEVQTLKQELKALKEKKEINNETN